MTEPMNKDPIKDRVSTMIDRSARLWAASLERYADTAGKKLRPDPMNTMPAIAKIWQDYLDNPHKLTEAATQYWTEQAELWTRIAQRAMGEDVKPVIEPARGDKRFKDDAWQDNPYFDYLKQSYLLTARWLTNQLEGAEGLEDIERKKLNLLTRNFIEATSPSNFASTNPEVIKATIAEEGENLIRGLENLTRDLERGRGTLLIRQTDMDAFKVGENMAVTPGKIVYQNEVMQVLQYAPATKSVHATPLLIVPPWINKFYVMDLNEKKSMIKWLVEQGHTVFLISWVNPTDAHRDETWESYMQKGVLTAIGKVLEETGEEQLNIVGYCIGATMVGTTLAWMAATGDKRVKSATFFTGQLEFSDAGELQAFVDEGVIDTVAEASEEHGYLAAENMFGAFNSLRSNDLIWSFVVNNYLLGKENFPFDLLYWNSDSTCMPGKVHTFYLDTFYNKNMLAQGKLKIAGEQLDCSKIDVPIYHLAAIEDHIAPAASAYRAAKILGSKKQKFVLAGSGHIAGVINPPALGKYQYWTKPGVKEPDLDSWREGAKETEGSWWPDWDRWLAKLSDKKVQARVPGAVLGSVEEAPGSYVMDRSDQR